MYLELICHLTDRCRQPNGALQTKRKWRIGSSLHQIVLLILRNCHQIVTKAHEDCLIMLTFTFTCVRTGLFG